MNWPFRGRSAELGHMQALLSRGETRGVLLVGAPGAGKTKLAREVVERAARAGNPTAWVAGLRSTLPIAFGAVAALTGDAPPAAPTVEFLQAVLHATRERIGHGARLVLGVDDAHLLDDASASVVHHLCVAGACFAVITARQGENLPDAVNALWRDGSLERIEAKPLAGEDIEAIAAEALPGPVDQFTLSELARLSQGNPLLLRELVLGGLDSEALYQEDGIWGHNRGLAAVPGLAAAIQARHEGLDDAERETLELLALGEPLPYELLEDRTEVVEGLERRALVHSGPDGARLAHPLHGEVLRAQLHGMRARRLYGTLAGLAAGSQLQPEDVVRVATWQLESGRPPDTATLLAAAGQALAVLDLDHARRLAEAALTRGRVHVAAGSWAEAETALRERVGSASTGVATEALHLRALALARAGHPVAGLGLLDDARGARRLTRAMVLAEAGEPQAASALLDSISPGDEDEALDLHTVASLLQAWLGRPLSALAHVEAGLRLTPSNRQARPLAEAMLEMHRVHALGMAGRLLEAEQHTRLAFDRALLAGVDELAGAWGVWLGWLLVLRGRPESAGSVLTAAASRLRRSDPLAMAPGCAALRAKAAAVRADPPAALAHLDELDELSQHLRHRFVTWAGRARAWTAAQQGDVSAATGHGLHAAAAEPASPPSAWGAFALHDAVRLGHPAAPELAEAVAEAEGDLLPLLSAHADAVERNDADAIDEASHAFEAIGAELYAAEAAMQASHAYRDAGRAEQARAAARRSAQLAARCEGAATPALGAPPGGLTRRELEVAKLAAVGHSDREISVELGIAVRTVENHLHRIYGKLRVAGRDELALALGP